ncbi:metallophosphoesterase domain-containing protein [Coniochaeta sp. 2T2.1]|nr:metallophosphoesterase domain-containing protein [Coniochaeta sp. 2T2.1]
MSEPTQLPLHPHATPVQPAPTEVKTKILIVSDTHGKTWVNPWESFPHEAVDVAIHCGDFTERSTLTEIKQQMLSFGSVKAGLKLVIPGDCDGTLDLTTSKRRYHEAGRADALDFGNYGDGKKLFERPFERKDGVDVADGVGVCGKPNIHFLCPGNHDFILKNGAKLKVYANSYTPSDTGAGAFEFKRGERFHYEIEDNVDVVITHGPPKGVLDRNWNGTRRGCDHLLTAVAKARPLLHCFGHIHHNHGIRIGTWASGNEATYRAPTEALDNPFSARGNQVRYVGPDQHNLRPGEQTLFVNAAVLGADGRPTHPPWIVEIGLPLASQSSYAEKYEKFFSTVETPVSGKMP